MANPTWLIAALGNPGSEYEKTRHNIGVMVADTLLDRHRAAWSRDKKSQSMLAKIVLPSANVIVCFPQTYMNRSGQSVLAVSQFYKIPTDNIIALHDELDIPFEAIRMKKGGGDNGHNGLKSIRSSLGSGEWFRVRLGIGRPPGQQDPANFVLKPFSAAEAKVLGVMCERAADAIETLITDGLEIAQSRYNQ